MKKELVIYSFSIFIILASCHMKGNDDTDGTSTSLMTESEFNIWINKNTVKKYEQIISFEAIFAEDDEYGKYDLPKTESTTEAKLKIYKDSITIEFLKYQWVGCKIIGDIRIENDTAKLLYCNICQPSQEVFIEEEALIRFKYVLQYSEKLLNLPWKPEERDLKK